MEVKNNNYSDTFGKFTDTSAFPRGGNKVKGPIDITSDMWTPISTGAVPEKNQETVNKREKEKQSDKNKKKEENSPSKERKPEKKKPEKKKKAKNQGKKEKNTKQNRKTPISEGRPETEKPPRKKTAGKKKNDGKKQAVRRERLISEEDIRRQEKERRVREKHEVNKNNREYEIQAKQGKSHNEISRKRAEMKIRNRRLRNIAAALVFFIFIGAFVTVYTYTKGAPVKHVVLEGESIYSQQQITAAAGIIPGVNMLSLKEKTINEAVTAALPYIHSVDIKRKLPDTVTVVVTPTIDKYLIVNGSGEICIDEYNKILSLKKHKVQDGKYRIYGFEKQTAAEGAVYEPSDNNKEKFDFVKRIVAFIEKEGVITSATINVTDMNDVRILYKKVMIYLGDCKELEKQLNLAGNVIKQAVTEGKSGYIDLRYSDMAFFNEGTINPD